VTSPSAVDLPNAARYHQAMVWPPGPRNVLMSTAAYLRDPYGTLLEGARKHGDPFRLPSFLGPLVVTGDPEAVKTIFATDPEAFGAIGADLLAPVLGEHNLLLLSGERHRAMRKLQTPPFHGARMRAYGELMVRVAEEQIARWPRDRSFDVHPTMQAISLEVILQAVLGLADAEPRRVFQEAVLQAIGALKPSFMFFRALRRELGGLSAWARFRRRADRLTSLLSQEVQRRRADARPREDILSLFLAARYDDGSALDEPTLFQQIINLIGAGHETTASSLSFALYHIHRDPEVRRRLVEELGQHDPETIAQLPYLEAVCLETLRLDPVAPMIGRTLRRPMNVKGYELPEGTSVGIAIVNVHRNPDLYREPEAFRPERFLGATFPPSVYLPFGGGARRCLGAAFALHEMKLVLATILRGRPLVLTHDRPLRAALRNTTVGPAGGVPMRLS
jgi:cytochrome P450